MFKKILIMALSCFLLLSCSSCGNKIKNKESVSVNEIEAYNDYKLKATPLSKEIVFEKDGIMVTLKNILYEDVTTKFVFNLNNKTDENVKILTTDLAINDFMSTDFMLVDVPSKSKKDVHIEISNEWFSELNIKIIKNIEYVIRVLDENSNEKFKSDVLSAKTKAFAVFNKQYDKEGIVVYNQDNIVFLARELKESKLSNDLELVFYIENNTNKQFSVMAQNVKVNGNAISPTFVITVGAKKKAVDSMLFEEIDLKAIQVTKIETVEASFKAFDDSLKTVFETGNIQIPVK